MKIRQGFVSNSSSSSFIGLLINDTDKPIELKEWFLKNIKALSNSFMSDGGSNKVDVVIQHAIVTEDWDVKYVLNDKVVNPNQKFRVDIEIENNQIERFNIDLLEDKKTIPMSSFMENIKCVQ